MKKSQDKPFQQFGIFIFHCGNPYEAFHEVFKFRRVIVLLGHGYPVGNFTHHDIDYFGFVYVHKLGHDFRQFGFFRRNGVHEFLDGYGVLVVDVSQRFLRYRFVRVVEKMVERFFSQFRGVEEVLIVNIRWPARPRPSRFLCSRPRLLCNRDCFRRNQSSPDEISASRPRILPGNMRFLFHMGQKNGR